MITLLFVIILFIPLSLLTLAYFLAFISFFGPPFVPTPQKTINEILKKLKLKPGMVFYDLGCGDGRVVRRAVKQYGVTGIGVDLNPFLIFYCRMVVWLQNTFHYVIPAPPFGGVNSRRIYKDNYLYRFRIPTSPKATTGRGKSGMTRKSLFDNEKPQSNNIQFLCASFFKINLTDADIIYMYPVPKVISKLVIKIKKECQPGTKIVSYCFEIKQWKGYLKRKEVINNKPVYYYSLNPGPQSLICLCSP